MNEPEQSVEHRFEPAQTDKAMNASGSNLYLTYGIIGINVLVFILMAINGAGILETNGIEQIKWGSNYSPLTLSGDWWRLITNVFIHFGIIHLLMNMYCLYTVGIYLEPMLGKAKYATAYLCTGVLASIVSLWWHKEGVNSAGASGAIFGMYGLFLALLVSNLIPKQIRQPLLQSIGIFIVYNLAYGMKSGVDNSAHVGGLVSGFIIGYLYVLSIKKERQTESTTRVLPLVLLITAGIAFAYLSDNKQAGDKRNALLNEINSAGYADADKFEKALSTFDQMHQRADSVFKDTAQTDEVLKQKINDVAIPQWKEADTLMGETKNYNISAPSHSKADKVRAYIQLKLQEMELFNQLIDTKKQEEFTPKIIEMRAKEGSLFDEILKM